MLIRFILGMLIRFILGILLIPPFVYFFVCGSRWIRRFIDHATPFRGSPLQLQRYDGVERSSVPSMTQQPTMVDGIPVGQINRIALRLAFLQILSKLASAVIEEVNQEALRLDFLQTLSKLESAMIEEVNEEARRLIEEGQRLWINKVVSWVWRYATSRSKTSQSRSAVKAAKLLLLVQKMSASGYIEETISKWAAAASKLLQLAFSAEIKEYLVKISEVLIKELENIDLKGRGSEFKKTVVKLIGTWLPEMSDINNSTNEPFLNLTEIKQITVVVEKIFPYLEEDQQWEVWPYLMRLKWVSTCRFHT